MPRWGTYISIDQLGYRRASVRDVVQLASTINRDAGLIILGMYNLALALASMKDGQEQQTERLNVQSALLRNSISEKRLREMKAKFPHSHLVTNPIFHRGQMLTMIKLVAKFGRGTGGNRLERRDDFDVIAELGLLVNSLTPHDLTGSERGDALAPSLAAALEIENPPSVAESMVRANAMLGPYLDRARIHDGFARQLERLFVFSSGLNFEELIDLTFAVWAYYNSLTVTDIIETQSLANFNPMNSKNVVSGKYMVKALDRYAIGFGEVPGLPFGSADASGLLTNHSALKSWPIWKFGDDNYFCVDPAFMQERLSSAFIGRLSRRLMQKTVSISRDCGVGCSSGIYGLFSNPSTRLNACGDRRSTTTVTRHSMPSSTLATGWSSSRPSPRLRRPTQSTRPIPRPSSAAWLPASATSLVPRSDRSGRI